MMTRNSLRNEIIEAIQEDLMYELSNDKGVNEYEDLTDIAIDSHHAVMDNMCTYTQTCKEIIEACDFDVFSDDNVLGERGNSVEQCAYIALMEVDIDIDEIIEEALEDYNKLSN